MRTRRGPAESTVPGTHFLARQAILDDADRTFGYELLFRNSLDNFFPGADADSASSRVISDSFLVWGIEELTGGSRAFINFSQSLIETRRPLLLPRERIVIELLESVRPVPEVVAACREFKKRGYLLALDDFVLAPHSEALLALADIIKIDFRQTPAAERASVARLLARRGLILLAEKVETSEEHDEGVALGYTLFQGYYYSRPVTMCRRDVPPQKVQYLRFIQAVNVADIRTDELARIIEADVSLSLRLLRYINAVALGLRRRVHSIRQGLHILGENEIRRWANLLAMAEMAADKPPELLRVALIRARMGELLAPRAALDARAADCFLLGLFSLLDAMLDRPQEEILRELPLAGDLQRALLGEENPLGDLLRLIKTLESGSWEDLGPLARQVGIRESELPPVMQDAIRFAEELGFRQPSHRTARLRTA